MPRVRALKAEFFTDEDVADLPPLTRLFFLGLLPHADKRGRLKDKPRTLKALILPFDQVDPSEILDELEQGGFILRYESQGVKVIQVRSWDKHQRPHHTEQESELPSKNNGATTVQPPLNNGASTEHSQDAPSLSLSPLGLKKSKFRAPSAEEVQKYAASIGYDLEGQHFVDYYEARGWELSGGKRMKDWRACVRTWKTREKKRSGGGDRKVQRESQQRKAETKRLLQQVEQQKDGEGLGNWKQQVTRRE